MEIICCLFRRVLFTKSSIIKRTYKTALSTELKTTDSFSFAKEVLKFDASFFMASFEIKVTFQQHTSPNQTYVGNLTKSSFYNLFRITMFESFLIFDWKFYERSDGVVMGFP